VIDRIYFKGVFSLRQILLNDFLEKTKGLPAETPIYISWMTKEYTEQFPREVESASVHVEDDEIIFFFEFNSNETITLEMFRTLLSTGNCSLDTPLQLETEDVLSNEELDILLLDNKIILI